MAKKSEIRACAKAGLDSLLAAGNTKDEETAGRHLKEAIVALTEASGLAPIGGGKRALKEAGKRAGDREPTRLLERMGLDENGEPLIELPHEDDSVDLLGRLGIDRDEF